MFSHRLDSSFTDYRHGSKNCFMWLQAPPTLSPSRPPTEAYRRLLELDCLATRTTTSSAAGVHFLVVILTENQLTMQKTRNNSLGKAKEADKKEQKCGKLERNRTKKCEQQSESGSWFYYVVHFIARFFFSFYVSWSVFGFIANFYALQVARQTYLNPKIKGKRWADDEGPLFDLETGSIFTVCCEKKENKIAGRVLDDTIDKTFPSICHRPVRVCLGGHGFEKMTKNVSVAYNFRRLKGTIIVNIDLNRPPAKLIRRFMAIK